MELKKFAFTHCPSCCQELRRNSDGYPACPICGFVHYDNPIPTVTCVVPMLHSFLLKVGMSIDGIPDGGLLLVKRAKEPFPGQWCLPCGFIERHAHPKAEGVRETHQETNVLVRIEKILCVCNPMPGEVNQIVVSYLARPVGGAITAGDDAADARVFAHEEMPHLCFRSHQMLADQYFAGKLGTLTGEDLEI